MHNELLSLGQYDGKSQHHIQVMLRKQGVPKYWYIRENGRQIEPKILIPKVLEMFCKKAMLDVFESPPPSEICNQEIQDLFALPVLG